MIGNGIRATLAAWLGSAFLCTTVLTGAASAQTVTTDKPDYDPGETALISGTGFHAAEAVTLQVIHLNESTCNCSGAGHLPWTTYADASGDISSSWYVDPDDSFGAIFLLTPDCPHGLHAEYVFTDALGTGRIANVSPMTGGCVQLTTIGAGPNAEQYWDLERSETYLVTLTNVSECFGTSLQVLVRSGNNGDQCLTATNNGPNQYSFVWAVPDDACRTFTVQYCTTNCDPTSGRVARQPNNTNQHVGHLRVNRFGPNCSNPTLVGEFECCPDPALECPGDITACTDAGQCCATVTFASTLSGGCPPVAIVSTPPSGTCFPIGTTQVTTTATDVNGFGVQCTFNVTVHDCEDPVINCPQVLTVCNDTGQCCAVVDLNSVVTATDNCGATLSFSPASGTCFPVGTTPVLCTATDAAGNTATCTLDVVVTDCEHPHISCPSNITQCNDTGNCSAVVTFADPGATDNCGISSVVCTPPSGSTFPVGTTTVHCLATDGAGNTASCTFDVTVNDCENPHITCPSNKTVCNDTGACAAIVNFPDPGATDNCGVSSVVCTPPSGSSFPHGTTTVHCVATDNAGNTASCTFDVTVNDCEDPHITCPSNMTVCNDTGSCSAIVTFADPGATDNCGVSSVVCTPASGSSFPHGTTTVHCVATDTSGNTASCTFDVTVNDCESPHISCPSNITTCNDEGHCCAVVNFTVGATDNCPGVVVNSTPPSGTCFPIGTTIVNSIATDAAGHQASCSFSVTVNDCESPTLSCPNDITAPTDPGVCCAVVNFTVGSNDNCPGVTVISSPASGTCFPLGTTIVTSTATDSAGHQANCTFTVTVVDQEPPTITCPPNFIETWNVGPPTQVDPNHTGWPTYSDNCSAQISYSDVFHPGLHPGDPETIVTRKWTVIDGSGNTDSCTQTITLLSPGGHGGVHLDMLPGVCPNTVKIWNPGWVDFALIGSFQFDTSDIVPNTLRLRRADGLGRQLSVHIDGYEDVATPFHGPLGGCHTLGADGEMDLSLRVVKNKLRRAFGLTMFPEGAQVEVMLTGQTYEGAVFEVHDFITVSDLP